MSRAPNTVVICPIVYGSVAVHLGKKAEEFKTHQWTLFVRGPQDEDLSCFVEKVAFTLHASFTNPVREVYQPPYEVVEYGWGEFEAGIRIYFRDPNEQPVDVFHTILLYPSPLAQGPGKQPVVAENYDEIVFADPSPPFHAQLMLYGSVNNPNRKATAFPEHYTGFDDALDLELLATIHSHVLTEVATAKQRLINLDAEVVETMNERKAQEAAQAAHMAVQVVQQEHTNAMDM